jgi:D-arabinitol dehydrogenase (NADP+)
VYEGPRRFRIASLPVPSPRPGEVRLRVLAAGICGTDLHIHEGGFFASFPLTPGHEILGMIDAIGEAVVGLEVGQKVVADNASVCGNCRACRRGESLFCENFHSLGVNAPGACADFLITKASKCYLVDDLAEDDAVLAEPTACAIHGMDRAKIRPGSQVLVLGAGPSGLILAQLAARGGAAAVTVAAPNPRKLQLARRLGADRTLLIDRSDPRASLEALKEASPEGFDLVIEATGAPAVAETAPMLARDGGSVLIYGINPEESLQSISLYQVFRRELTIKGSFAQVNCFERAVAALRGSRVSGQGIVTHRFGLEEFGAALNAVRDDPSCLKAVIRPEMG